MSTELTARVPALSEPLPPERRKPLVRAAKKAKDTRDELVRLIVEERDRGVSLRILAEAVAEGTGNDSEAAPTTPEGISKIVRRAKTTTDS